MEYWCMQAEEQVDKSTICGTSASTYHGESILLINSLGTGSQLLISETLNGQTELILLLSQSSNVSIVRVITNTGRGGSLEGSLALHGGAAKEEQGHVGLVKMMPQMGIRLQGDNSNNESIQDVGIYSGGGEAGESRARGTLQEGLCEHDEGNGVGERVESVWREKEEEGDGEAGGGEKIACKRAHGLEAKTDTEPKRATVRKIE
jgi:hypothetical protein